MGDIGAFGYCVRWIRSRDGRADNVIATETVFLNWGSAVAVTGDDRLVEFRYVEPIPAEAEQSLSQGTTKESYYAIADGYLEDVLSVYTESMIGLLRLAASASG